MFLPNDNTDLEPGMRQQSVEGRIRVDRDDYSSNDGTTAMALRRTAKAGHNATALPHHAGIGDQVVRT
ncbi:MAG: hypothetical protein GY947_08445 [Rhodobacteraceae bacterium]|nr:hypothetical protein [Paracoccaceae bacterium]